jgi:hypothetical protein
VPTTIIRRGRNKQKYKKMPPPKVIEHNGKRMNISARARHFGISDGNLHGKLKRLGLEEGFRQADLRPKRRAPAHKATVEARHGRISQ